MGNGRRGKRRGLLSFKTNGGRPSLFTERRGGGERHDIEDKCALSTLAIGGEKTNLTGKMKNGQISETIAHAKAARWPYEIIAELGARKINAPPAEGGISLPGVDYKKLNRPLAGNSEKGSAPIPHWAVWCDVIAKYQLAKSIGDKISKGPSRP